MNRLTGRSVAAFLVFATLRCGPSAPPAPVSPPAPVLAGSLSEQEVVDTYEYMLARWLVLRQQTRDFDAGMRWNTLVPRASAPAGPDPDVDVAHSDAWIAVDETSCTMLETPQITDRYSTVQLSDGWGSVIANINERRNPRHPYGKFAICLRGAPGTFPQEVRRIDVPVRAVRALVRIELGASAAKAVALQKQVKMKATGSPKAPEIPVRMSFPDDRLPGIEGFDAVEAIFASDPDTYVGLQPLQAGSRAIAKAAADPKERARLDQVIRTRAIPAFQAEVAKLGPEMNRWVRPRAVGEYGRDYLARSVVNYVAPWSNRAAEVTSYYARALDGGTTLVQLFVNTNVPRTRARSFWSVTALDSVTREVLANPLQRYRFDEGSRLAYAKDGSLTLAYGPTKPDGIPESNWLPTVAGKRFDLVFRVYGPTRDVLLGQWAPPPLSPVNPAGG